MDNKGLQELVNKTWRAYGKIGLLIDDAPDAGASTARQLYGTETLPQWWLEAKSIECATVLLGTVRQLKRNGSENSAVVIIDRTLPATCGGQSNPRAWDRESEREEDDETRSKFRAFFQEIVALLDAPAGMVLEFVTSFPPTIDASRASESLPQDRIRWKTRTIEALAELRRNLPVPLLRFGPEANALVTAPPVLGLEAAGLPEEKWLAHSWVKEIDDLAAEMAASEDEGNGPFILLTGVGASLPTSTYGPGVPRTSWIVHEALRVVASGQLGERLDCVQPTGSLAKPLPVPPPSRPDQCRCQHTHHRSDLRSKDAAVSLEALAHILQGQEGLYAGSYPWKIEEFFDRKCTLNERLRLLFARAFKLVLQRFDDGFAYHHWLLAQLPWTAIITTNFDGFHERAAYAASRTVNERERVIQQILRRGAACPTSTLTSRRKGGRPILEDYGLFKPYGNLLELGPILMSFDDVTTAETSIRKALSLIPKRAGARLVVIGQSMNDTQLAKKVLKLGARKGFKALWVDPLSHNRAAAVGLDLPDWDRNFHRTIQEFESKSGKSGRYLPMPIDATAFAHDLWHAYRRKQPR